MPRLLSQLRCGRCASRFWPDSSSTVFVLCPACGAAHVHSAANTEAVEPRAWIPADLGDWLRTWWADALPAKAMVSPVTNTATRWTGSIDGYAVLATTVRAPKVQHREIHPPHVAVMVACLPPHTGPGPTVHGLATRFVRGGLVLLEPREARVDALVPAVVAAARSAGATPLHPLVEVDDPTPLDRGSRDSSVVADPAADARIESERVTCSSCGAPSTCAALIGDRCPYCSAPQALSPEATHALRSYRERVRVMLLRGSDNPFTNLFAGAPPPPPAVGSVVVACMNCGAPNAHRAGAHDERCTSCRAWLMPGERVVVRGLATAGDAQARDHQQLALRATRRQANAGVHRGASAVFGLGLGGLMVVATLGYWAALAANQASEGSTIAIYVLIAIGAVVLLGGAAAVLALLYSRRRGRAQIARWGPRIDALVDQLGAHVIPPSQLFRWSEQWWRDGLAPAWLRGAGPSRVVMTAPAAGFPVAVSAAIEAHASLTERASQHLVWLLAARLPRDAPYRARQADAARVIADLRAVGLEVQLRTGGLAMLAERAMIERLAREPDRLAYLAPLTLTFAHLAHRLGAEPPAASASAAVGAHSGGSQAGGRV